LPSGVEVPVIQSRGFISGVVDDVWDLAVKKGKFFSLIGFHLLSSVLSLGLLFLIGGQSYWG
jgi:hypothetical protein